MKLIEYNTTARHSQMHPTISFSIKGVISLNKLAVQTLQLQSGDKIAFFQDAERPADWYVKKSAEGATVRDYTNDKGGLICNFSEVSRKILTQVKKDSARIRLAAQPAEGNLYAILTKSI